MYRRKWQPTPVFLPGESQGRGSLVGCCLWGRTESDMTEATSQQQQASTVHELRTSIYLRWIIEKTIEFQRNIYFCFIDYTTAFDYVDHNKLWEILKQIGISDHPTCLLRNLYAGQEATVRIGHETTSGSKFGKESVRVVYYHPAYLT